MSDPPPPFDEDELRLRRFLDGELDDAASAEFGRRLGGDPDLARRAAAELGVSALLSGLRHGPLSDPLASCRRVRALFEPYRRQIAAPQEVAELSAHFAVCPGCEAEYEIASRPDRASDFDAPAPCVFERVAATTAAVLAALAVCGAIVMIAALLANDGFRSEAPARKPGRHLPPATVDALRGEVAGYLGHAAEGASQGGESLWAAFERWAAADASLADREDATAALRKSLEGDEEGRRLLVRLVELVEPHVPAGEERRRTVYALHRDLPGIDPAVAFARAVRNWAAGDPVAAARCLSRAAGAENPPSGITAWLASILPEAVAAPTSAAESLLRTTRSLPADPTLDASILRLANDPRSPPATALAAASTAADRGLDPAAWLPVARRAAALPDGDERRAAGVLLSRSPFPADRLLAAAIERGGVVAEDPPAPAPFGETTPR